MIAENCILMLWSKANFKQPGAAVIKADGELGTSRAQLAGAVREGIELQC